ncbi:MAG: hypothetical protein HY907_16615 [Deltaproteobacteria bacterium]|nr:hypothetical protein [Deltaproteobacteria bacterium]
MTTRTLARLSALFLAATALPACGGGEDGYDRNAPWGAISMTTRWETDLIRLDGTHGIFTGSLDQQTIGGTTFTRYLLQSDINSADVMFAPFPLEADDGIVSFGGIHNSDGVLIEPVGPLTIDILPDVGVPTALTGTVNIMTPPMTAPVTVTLDATYTLVSTDASAESSMGLVHGCRHYSATGSVSGAGLPAALSGVPLNVQVWYHPSLGFVRYELPELGLGGDLRGTWDLDDAAGEFGSIRKVGIIEAGNPTFELDTYDLHGAFDADKNTHAKMLLELRWVDEDRARTGPEPGYPAVDIEFGTVMGIFPATMVESPVSIFHPEENGQGYKYWIGFVDEAARNEPGSDGIAYHVSVQADTDITPPLRATARIYYRRLP